ncbi:hypothetical protein [Paeniglutamicibacter antarcticus]|uniref:Uncharacterized protein n=1 Tax=Paeniglutamicibacter antarcticus TaxID=494023 RepID=A0ABP9TID6_9MICC
MNEQTGKQHPEDDEADDFGTVSFGRVSGGTANGLPYLSSLSYHFDDGAPDPVAGKQAFGTDIAALNGALVDYDRVLASRADDFTSAFATVPGEDELSGASDRVHEALESLGLSHQAYTGHAFLQGPLYREPYVSSEELRAQLLESSEFTEDVDLDEHCDLPSPHELGSTVVFDRVLHQSATEVLRLDMAKVFSRGVMLVIDYANLRGADEDALLWFRRSNEQHGNVGISLQLHDPAGGKPYSSELQWAEANNGPRCYVLNAHFWVPGASEAESLLGRLTVTDAITADGSMEPLVTDIRIDTAQLREAETRVRSIGHWEPGP